MRSFNLFCFVVISNSLFAQLVINEYSPLKGTYDMLGNESDWVEIYNTSENSINLSNYYLSDNLDDLSKWQLPSIDLSGHSRMLIYCSGMDTVFFESMESAYHTNFKLSFNESLCLSVDNQIIDELTVDSNLYFGLSKGRLIDGSSSWCFFNSPTPNITNNQAICYPSITPAPEISLESGWYSDQQSVICINSSNETSIHYTIDGQIPDELDNLYSQPISVDSTMIISLRAFSSENLPSKVVDRTYILEQDNHNLYVYSIHTDPANLWDYYQGIYTFGPNPSLDYPYYGSNFWQPWSKFSRVEFFNKDKTKECEEHLDLEIHGGWSRAEPQKSFRLDFKSKYTGRFEYPLFSTKPSLYSFNNLNIRNGGQHSWSDKIQDAVFSNIASKTQVDYMAYEPCIVYLNGEYWGVYGVREKIDEHSIADNYLLQSDEVDLMNSFGVLNGTSEHITASFDFLLNQDQNNDNFYQLFADRFDVQNYIDYFVIQTYIQNMDWMGIAWGANNIKVWKPQGQGGKIHYVLYDTDGSFGYFNGNEWAEWDNYLQFAMWPAYPTMHSELFNKVLQNETFKCEFTSRYADLINTVFKPDSFATTVNSIKNTLLPAMNDHVERWINSPTINGTLQSINHWESTVDDIINYNALRRDPAVYFLNETLALDGSLEIGLDVQPVNTGKIKLNTIIPENYPWNGVYFNNCDLELVAIPNQGNEFLYWMDNNNFQIFDDTISFNASNDDFLIAHFGSCEDILSAELTYEKNTITSIINSSIYDYSYNWTLNGQPIEEGFIISNPVPGFYQLTLNSSNCQVLSNTVLVSDHVGETVYSSDIGQFKLFPNPTSGRFKLEFMSNEKTELFITNVLSEKVYYESINAKTEYQKTLDLSNQSSGVYYLTIESNNEVINKKLILY